MEKIELWADIKGYEGYYQVSTFGNVRSMDRDFINKRGAYRSIKGRLLCKQKDKYGYLYVLLSAASLYPNQHPKHCTIHRLVAKSFIPIPHTLLYQGYTYDTLQVNHKDENKENNCVENLEWCTPEYNVNYGTHNQKFYKPISQFGPDGFYIKTYPSIREACKEFTDKIISSISYAASGKRNSAFGFYWRYHKSIYKPGYKLKDIKKRIGESTHIPVNIKDIITNTIIAKCRSIDEAGRFLHMKKISIHNCFKKNKIINGRYKLIRSYSRSI